MRFSFALLVCLFISGCAMICPQQKQVFLQDQQSFSQAFDAFKSTRQIVELQTFITEYPESNWVGQAEIIIRFSQELDQCKARMEKMDRSARQQTLEHDQLRKRSQQLTATIEPLQKQNKRLTETIEKLKSSLIQSESRPK